MTDEQFDSWWILEGLEEWTLCDRGKNTTIKMDTAPTRWALRSKTHAVYMSVGKVKRSKFAAEAGRDVAASWAKARRSEVPAGVISTLVALAQGGRK